MKTYTVDAKNGTEMILCSDDTLSLAFEGQKESTPETLAQLVAVKSLVKLGKELNADPATCGNSDHTKIKRAIELPTTVMAILSNGTKIHGPIPAVMSWLAQHLGHRPWESLPIAIAESGIRSAAQAAAEGEQWTEFKDLT